MLLFVLFYFMFALVNLMLTKYLYKQSCFHFVKKNERNKLNICSHIHLYLLNFSVYNHNLHATGTGETGLLTLALGYYSHRILRKTTSVSLSANYDTRS